MAFSACLGLFPFEVTSPTLLMVHATITGATYTVAPVIALAPSAGWAWSLQRATPPCRHADYCCSQALTPGSHLCVCPPSQLKSNGMLLMLLDLPRKLLQSQVHTGSVRFTQGQQGLLPCRLSRGGSAAFGEAAATAPPEQVAQVAQAMAANPGARGMDLAAKMMEKMGWKSGLGLGRNKQVSRFTSVYVLSPSALCNKRPIGTCLDWFVLTCLVAFPSPDKEPSLLILVKHSCQDYWTLDLAVLH